MITGSAKAGETLRRLGDEEPDVIEEEGEGGDGDGDGDYDWGRQQRTEMTRITNTPRWISLHDTPQGDPTRRPHKAPVPFAVIRLNHISITPIPSHIRKKHCWMVLVAV